jgi:hypothetical protein
VILILGAEEELIIWMIIKYVDLKHIQNMFLERLAMLFHGSNPKIRLLFNKNVKMLERELDVSSNLFGASFQELVEMSLWIFLK